VDVRIIAATNRDLEEMVKAGSFRQDLFFRLNVFTILLPPLRARLEDIPLLANHFLGATTGGGGKKISSSTHRLLMGHDWPGNVRELKNAIEASAVLTEGEITPGHLPGFIISGVSERQDAANATATKASPDGYALDQAQMPEENLGLDDQVRAFEKGLIVEALTRARGVQVRAATILGIKERSLWHRLKKHRIDASTFKKNP
jgi:DNA-binding NtrC family response regulator